MSQQAKYRIQCPKCQHEQEVSLHESINLKDTPELKQALLSNQLNTVVCEQCKASFRVDKPILYHDPAHSVMIYLIPLNEESFEQGERKFVESLQRLNGKLPKESKMPDVCLVFSRIELVERIFLFDAGLDERIIEYIKYLIYSHNLKKIDPAEKALLFNAEDSTPDALCFVTQDIKTKKLESVIQYERKTYNALCEMFDRDDKTASLLELFPGPHISARALLLKDSKVETSPTPERLIPPLPPVD